MEQDNSLQEPVTAFNKLSEEELEALEIEMRQNEKQNKLKDFYNEREGITERKQLNG